MALNSVGAPVDIECQLRAFWGLPPFGKPVAGILDFSRSPDFPVGSPMASND